MDFANPFTLLLISPVVLAGWYAVRKGISRSLMISRVIILSLLIIALASPFTLGTSTIKDEAPKVTVISDQTMSMDLFNKDTGQKVYDSLKSKTPTTYRQFAGITSPIGDEVISAAENNNLVLVSDGNNNYGKDLSEAISFVTRTGTRVYAVRQEPIHNDASVEIASPKNLIVGNENVFNIVVRQAGNETSYRLDIQMDGASAHSESITQTERMKIIPVSYTFNSLGNHQITATITPSGEDWFKINNVFYRSVYVVPKPKVLAVTSDKTSPLYTIVSSLYDTTTTDTLPDDLSPYKAVIIDNKGAAQLSADTLNPYVSGGGGLVVVGGDASYDNGLYNNSPVEGVLPVISRAAEYQGGRNLIILIDTSGSTALGDATTGLTFIGLIDANAINLIQNVASDTRVGVVAFSGVTAQTDILPMGSEANRQTLISFVKEIGPKGGENPTDLDKGLRASEKLLDSVSGSKEIIVISDGQIHPDGFNQEKNTVTDLKSKGIKMQFVQVLTSPETLKEPYPLYNDLAQAADGQATVLNPDERASTLIEQGPSGTPAPTPTATPEVSYQYPLVAVDSNHFITKYINITASVTGYNDVTPKLGSDLLVATNKGKPILTTWNLGLGRVASFTTDNGGGNTLWASEVYSGNGSQLISSMINWAIGDPRPKGDVVIQAEDIWGGTPGKAVITSNTLPQVMLDGKPLDLTRTGQNTYEAQINLEKDGFHDLSGYGIAVNYPLEYREIGFNEDLKSAIESNGGRVYNENEVEGLLLLDIKNKAIRTVEEPQSEKEPFLLAALGLFLAEVVVRRLKDYRKERPQIEENPPKAAPVEPAAEAAE
jgi:uncharacterized membrane protein/Mg-chelatase subunit ChlD